MSKRQANFYFDNTSESGFSGIKKKGIKKIKETKLNIIKQINTNSIKKWTIAGEFSTSNEEILKHV